MLTKANFLSFPRSVAVTASLTAPNLVDAGFTALVQTHESEAIRKKFSAYFKDSSSVEKHLKYKYQLLIDGNSCAYSRALWQLFSNCLILKQDSSSIQWYYDALLPYVHYIPLKNDMGDVKEKVIWAKKNEETVLKIIKNANNFAKDNLKQSDALYYLYILLIQYAEVS